MSLSFALDMTMRGLMSTTSHIQLTSSNITNAGKAGYTRKEGQDSYVSTNSGTVPVRTSVVSTKDLYLTKQTVSDVGQMGMAKSLNDILDYYSSQLGATDGSSTMSSYLNKFYGALQQLAVSPETLANKTEAVQIATNLADSVKNLSGTIQDLRLQADNKINDNVDEINGLLDKINSINKAIVPGLTADASMAEFDDQRMAALEELGKKLDIQYYFTGQNQVNIFTKSGQPLLQASANHINYTQTTPVTSSTVFQPITVNGVDITASIRTGEMAGNIQARDHVMVDEQAKLDQFAAVLKTQINTISNKGASLPPQITMTGSLRGLTSGTALNATGTLRLAVVNNNGVLQNYADLNMASYTTVGALVTAIDAIPNIDASLDVNGSLVIKSTLAGSGVALNEMNTSVSPSGQGASMYFGMQDVFTGTNGRTLNVSTYLASNPNYLTVGKLSSGTIAAGDSVVTRGDGSSALAMAKIIQTNVPFAAAGNFSSQSNTMTAYIGAFMADGATQAKLSQSQYDTAETSYSATKTALSNSTGVNVDEETAKLLALQNAYQASARLISAIKNCFDELLAAVAS